ncbi:MAG: hypothetical protein HY055_09710 [Magnetospirillum sp.]|nr:hypothetical protein [Magnetospirillum sp.]
MTARKPTTLDDLDRDELLELIRNGFPRTGYGYSERDLVSAQCDVAHSRLMAALDQVAAMNRSMIPLAVTVDETTTKILAARDKSDLPALKRALRLQDKALAAYRTKQAEEKKLDARAEKLRRRSDRLFTLWKDLSE